MTPQPLVQSQQFLWKTVKESMAESLALPLQKDPGIQGHCRSYPPVWCRDLGSRSEADQATGAVSPMLLALNPWHQMVRAHVKWRSPQQSQPAQLRVHFASGTAGLGWPCYKDGQHTHAQSSLLQRAPRRKAWAWCSKNALQRSAEETACTGRNQPSVTAAGGLRPRQLVVISGKPVVSSRQRDMKPQRKNTGGRETEQHLNHPQPKPSSVQSAAGCAHQESDSTAKNEHARIDFNLPKNPHLQRISHQCLRKFQC